MIPGPLFPHQPLTINSVVHPSWVRTALTEPFTSRPEFKDPMLEPTVVSTAVVNQVLSGRSAQLILPTQLTFLSTLRSWPSWFQERLRNEIANVLKFAEE
jgi:all-trans-retinol dehydrogenase (NAD+)